MYCNLALVVYTAATPLHALTASHTVHWPPMNLPADFPRSSHCLLRKEIKTRQKFMLLRQILWTVLGFLYHFVCSTIETTLILTIGLLSSYNPSAYERTLSSLNTLCLYLCTINTTTLPLTSIFNSMWTTHQYGNTNRLTVLSKTQLIENQIIGDNISEGWMTIIF